MKKLEFDEKDRDEVIQSIKNRSYNSAIQFLKQLKEVEEKKDDVSM